MSKIKVSKDLIVLGLFLSILASIVGMLALLEYIFGYVIPQDLLDGLPAGVALAVISTIVVTSSTNRAPLKLFGIWILTEIIGWAILIGTFCICTNSTQQFVVYLTFGSPAMIVAASFLAAWQSKRREYFMSITAVAVIMVIGCIAFSSYYQHRQKEAQYRCIRQNGLEYSACR